MIVFRTLHKHGYSAQLKGADGEWIINDILTSVVKYLLVLW
jgi:hypothetical protein